jgi:hypothetical protein
MNDQSFNGEGVDRDRLRTRRLQEVFARRGFHPSCEVADISDALALGETALGGGLVPAGTVEACERHTGRCFFIRRDEGGRAEGFIALLFLNRAGFEALMFGRFNPEDPALDHLAASDERAMAIYVWCLAGSTPEAQRAVVRAVTEARRKAFPDIALFARPVSREGRMMTAALDAPGAGAAWLGWVPARPLDDDSQGGGS